MGNSPVFIMEIDYGYVLRGLWWFGGMEFLVGIEFLLEYSTYSGYEGNTPPFSIELDKGTYNPLFTSVSVRVFIKKPSIFSPFKKLQIDQESRRCLGRLLTLSLHKLPRIHYQQES
ncbi:hypothetical protein RYX36_006869 [Vicia faba]